MKQEGFTSRPVPEAESTDGAGLPRGHERPAEARALIEAGRKLDPASPVVLEADGLLAELEDRDDDAKAAFARAAEQPGARLLRPLPPCPGPARASPDRETLARIEARCGDRIEGNDAFAYGYSVLAETRPSSGRPPKPKAWLAAP